MAYPANPPPYSSQEPAGIQVIHVQPAAGHYVTTSAAPVLFVQPVGPKPALIVCQFCRHQIMTTIEVRPSARTHLWAICLALIGCWPCMCIPYCTPSCMNVDHYCPNCNSLVGKCHN